MGLPLHNMGFIPVASGPQRSGDLTLSLIQTSLIFHKKSLDKRFSIVYIMNEHSFNHKSIVFPMSPRTREQFDQIRAKSRDAIMQSALELFTRKGYHGTSVSMIAKNAGVSTGLMYNYFGSKLELLEAIVQHGIGIISSEMSDIDSISDPRKQITAMVESTLQVAMDDMHFWSLYFHIMMQPDLPKNVQKIFADFIQGMFEGMEMVFAAAGFAEPDSEARIFGAILDGILLHYWMIGENYPIENVKNMLIAKYAKQLK